MARDKAIGDIHSKGKNQGNEDRGFLLVASLIDYNIWLVF